MMAFVISSLNLESLCKMLTLKVLTASFGTNVWNEHWFENLTQAQQVITDWRQDYNDSRPHSSCCRMPPTAFAALHRQQLDRAQKPCFKKGLNLGTGLPNQSMVRLQGAG